MTYITQFQGKFVLTPQLNHTQIKYLQRFSETPRIQRDPNLVGVDELREAVGLPVGKEAEYFVGGEGYKGPQTDDSVVCGYKPPAEQPYLWCHWTVSDTGADLYVYQTEYDWTYIQWLSYLIDHFFQPWGVRVEGTVTWSGEDSTDIGKITIENNGITTEYL
jgi:hypothetical protein